MDFLTAMNAKLAAVSHKYAISGVVSVDGTVFPLGSDTKVLSTIFELFARPLMLEIAREHGMKLIEPNVQNHYPDFTLCFDENDQRKIAVDVKTTYVNNPNDAFSYTLGGYTSFIRPGNERKNIVFPFTDYAEHWVIGFVYERAVAKKAQEHVLYTVADLGSIPLPYRNVRVFVQEKWRIASYRAGSGNTTNIGSIVGRIDDFIAGRGPFRSEEEFLDYWRGYGKTNALRGDYKDISGYRTWKAGQTPAGQAPSQDSEI